METLSEKGYFNWLMMMSSLKLTFRNAPQIIRRIIRKKVWKTSKPERASRFKEKFWIGSRTSIFLQEIQRTWSTRAFKGKKLLYYQKRRKLMDYMGTRLKWIIYCRDVPPNWLRLMFQGEKGPRWSHPYSNQIYHLSILSFSLFLASFMLF